MNRHAQTIAAADAIRAEYAAHRAEQEACGYEVVPFEQWVGLVDLKDQKMSEWQSRFDNDTADLY